MNWLKRVLGFREPEKHSAPDREPVIANSVSEKPKRKFANACEENDAFIDDHWDLYPDYIQEHIRNYREITKLSDL